MNARAPERHRRIWATLLAAAAAAALGGCSIAPVAATDRGRLAKEVMQRDVSAQHLELELHAYSSKEGTAGGYAVAGGGCGCN